mmetsp:Transcript_41247/g.96593  ORF Transcript_41247/g.96593 Transcript_41247/m.96593 type:complete len:257 (+) Transcript_41247:1466-2236(+)
MLVVAAGDPGVDVVARQGRQRHRRGQSLGLDADPPDELVERDALDAQVVVGRQLLGHSQVVTRLGFTRVGDGGRADLEIALGRGQLLRDRGLVGPRGGQRILGGQHVEIGRGQAHDQVLLGDLQIGLGRRIAATGLVDGRRVGGVVDRILALQTRRQRRAVDAGRPRPAGRLGACLGAGDRQAQRGPQQRLGLGRAGGGGVGSGLAGQVGGVISPRGVVEVLQALGLGRAGEQEAGRKGQRLQVQATGLDKGHGIP